MEEKLEIIDFHCHPFADSSDNLCFFKEVMPKKCEDILEDMSCAGVSRFCGSVIKGSVVRPLKFTGFDILHRANMDALSLRDKFGERYIPGFHVSPQFVEESLNEIQFASENNIKLIGELVPYLHGNYSYFSDKFSVLLEEIEKKNMILSLHRMNLEEIEKSALRHKNLRIVSAHVGEYSDIMKYCEIMKKCENIYIDISAVTIFRAGTLAYLCRQVGADRILFGSDYPIEHLSVCIQNVMHEKISDKEKEMILGKNTKRLLDL